MGSEFQSITAAGALFFLGLVSPGPNFLVVIESTLRGGQRSGIFTGLGASTGDGLYALIGLLGFSTLSSQGESLFQALISVLWRLALCRLFSTPALRAWYAKYSLLVERVFGGVLILLGWRMASGVGRSVPNR